MIYSNNLTGNAGEFFVCSQLSKKGLLTLMTPKNNPLFDIVVTNESGSEYIAIQVKTMGIENIAGWKLSKKITVKKNNPKLYLVLVDLEKNNISNFYVYLYDEFVDRINSYYKSYISKPHSKTGGQKKDVSFRWFDYKDFNEDDKSRKNDWSIITDNFNLG